MYTCIIIIISITRRGPDNATANADTSPNTSTNTDNKTANTNSTDNNTVNTNTDNNIKQRYC